MPAKDFVKTVAAITLALFTIVYLSACVLANTYEGVVVIYGSHLCPACSSLEKFFDEQGFPHVFRDVSLNESYANDFYRIVSIAKLDVAVPTSAVVVNGRVTALVQGAILDVEFWRELLNGTLAGKDKVYVFYFTPEGKVSIRFLENKTLIDELNSIVVKGSIIHEVNVGLEIGILPVLLSLAIADSINPCAIVFLAIIITSIAFTSKARKYATALAYVLGVYATYFAIGIGLSFILSISRFLLIAVAVFGYSFVIFGLLPAKVKWLNNASSSLRRKMLVKMVTKYSVPISFSIGSITAITFMMCSSAPYFVFLAFLNKKVVEFYSKIPYIALYNAIIIIPLILTALASSYVADKVSGKYVRILRDVLIIIVSTYALYITLTS